MKRTAVFDFSFIRTGWAEYEQGPASAVQRPLCSTQPSLSEPVRKRLISLAGRRMTKRECWSFRSSVFVAGANKKKHKALKSYCFKKPAYRPRMRKLSVNHAHSVRTQVAVQSWHAIKKERTSIDNFWGLIQFLCFVIFYIPDLCGYFRILGPLWTILSFPGSSSELSFKVALAFLCIPEETGVKQARLIDCNVFLQAGSSAGYRFPAGLSILQRRSCSRG